MSIPSRALGAALALATCGWMTACDTKPRTSEPSHALPPIAEAPPEPAAPMPHAEHALVDPGTAENADPHGAMPANPHAAPGSDEAMTPGEIEFDKKTVIAGQLKLDAKTKDKVKAGDTIFLVVRGVGDGATPGPVLAVRKLDAATFPMAFQLDSRDAMVVGTTLHAPVVVTARVDKDGDAITKNPGDVVGTATIKSLPQEKVSLVLDTVM